MLSNILLYIIWLIPIEFKYPVFLTKEISLFIVRLEVLDINAPVIYWFVNVISSVFVM